MDPSPIFQHNQHSQATVPPPTSPHSSQVCDDDSRTIRSIQTYDTHSSGQTLVCSSPTAGDERSKPKHKEESFVFALRPSSLSSSPSGKTSTGLKRKKPIPAGIPTGFPSFLQWRVDPGIGAAVTTSIALVLWTASFIALIYLYLFTRNLLTQDPGPPPEAARGVSRFTLALLILVGTIGSVALTSLVMTFSSRCNWVLTYLCEITFYLSVGFAAPAGVFIYQVISANPVKLECEGCPPLTNPEWWKIQVAVGIITPIMIIYTLYHSCILVSFERSLPPRRPTGLLESGIR